ncbi:MAG: hypothetical protein RR837_09990 [Bacteroidales bacterium]
MKKMIYSFAALLLLAACNSNSSKLNQLQMENDSLVAASTQTKAEFDELLSTLNEVEDGFSQIKDAENYLTVQAQATNDLTPSTKEKLVNDMQLIQQTLQNNREQIAKLQKQYDNSRYQSAEMKKTIARLTQEIETKSEMIASLQQELSRKDVKIAELSQSLTELAGTVDQLSEETKTQQKELAAQEKEINTAYYVFGTKGELKEQGIVSGGGLFESTKVLKGNFNKDYFTKVDVRTLKEVQLFAKKAKMLSNMPSGSYSFVKDDKGELTLVINDAKSFWSLSKYLVIQVD